MRISPREFELGGLEHHGDVQITREHGAYIVKGFCHDGSHVVEGFRTLTAARKFARDCSKTRKAKKGVEVQGWGKLLNRWHDESRTAHLLKHDGSPACGVKYFSSSGVQDVGEHSKCRRCKKIAR